jgi:hypothetical protein
MATVNMSMQTTGNTRSRHRAAAIVAKLATVRATRPDLADWCERVPAAAELLCIPPWEARWAALPDAAHGTASLLAAWATPTPAGARLPAAFAALAEAQALAAHGVAAWPPASEHPELIARCLVGLSATPAAVAHAIALAGDQAALAAALQERAGRALDAAVLLANLPPNAHATMLAAAAAAPRHAQCGARRRLHDPRARHRAGERRAAAQCFGRLRDRTSGCRGAPRPPGRAAAVGAGPQRGWRSCERRAAIRRRIERIR